MCVVSEGGGEGNYLGNKQFTPKLACVPVYAVFEKKLSRK